MPILLHIMNQIFWILAILLVSCQSDAPSDATLRRQNQKGEYLYRTHDQVTLIPPMEPVVSTSYSWDKSTGHLMKISKEYFRCKGSALNPVRSETVRGEIVKYHDCGGSQRHSLPLRDGKEWISPILIDLCNYIQIKTGKRVIITSGYRCPEHNTYVDSSPSNQTSKHQIGAEVDFYIQGLENKPEVAIQWIHDYYQNKYKDKKEFEFKRYDKETNVSTQPWINKELFIKLYKAKEGRNYDNRHPYPYISLQVRYDLEKNERIIYSWDQAFRNFLRY